MFGNLWMRLGKFVQGILNNFKKKKPQYEPVEGTWTIQDKPIDIKFSPLSSASDDSLIGKNVELKDGEVFLNGVSFGKVKSIETISLSDEIPEDIIKNFNEPIILEGTLESELLEMLQNLANTSKPVLPKRIKVPTLLVSVCANWDYDSIGVDISQLEETGIAHYFCTTTRSMEEWHADLYGDEEECIYDDMETIRLHDATLYEWEDGHWTWSF